MKNSTKDRCKDYCGNYDECTKLNEFCDENTLCPHFIFDMIDSFTKEERDIIQQRLIEDTLFQ